MALRGAMGHLIEVQADVSDGVVGTSIVGRVDSALSESRERVRMAIVNGLYEWPSSKRVTVLLSPADLPKSGSHFDLAIAVAVMAATGQVEARGFESTAFIGELTLAGNLRSVHGVLPMVLAALKAGLRSVIVPQPQVDEARMVPGIDVSGVESLAQVVALMRAEPRPDAPPVPPLGGDNVLSWRGSDRLEEMDMADLIGLQDVRFAMEVAAAGGHHILLSGPKGCGKTSIAERIPGILPDLEPEEAVEITAVRSLAGVLDPRLGLETRPPFLAPHHDASKASVVGGGTGRVRPGQISLAHAGVVFLDEFPLFRNDVVQALREPLENGDITIARGDEMVTLPARSIVVLAANPCPCGNFYPRAQSRCTCRETERRDYRGKVSGPIADRIDITRNLLPFGGIAGDGAGAEDSATIRARVVEARSRQIRRYVDESWRLNAQAPGVALRQRWPLAGGAQDLVDKAVLAGHLTLRGAVRVHRLAMTVADLAGRDLPDEGCVDTALRLRSGEALKVSQLTRSVPL
ncbi:MAG: YifB family Mg chelatase-like AAA ATPase [Nocardioides sp.]